MAFGEGDRGAPVHGRLDLGIEPEQQPGVFEQIEEMVDRRRLGDAAELVDERSGGALEEVAGTDEPGIVVLDVS